MKKILCAVDEFEHAKSAAALAAQMAKAMGAELTLLAVNELEGIGGVHYLWDDAELEFVLEHAKAAAEEAGVLDPKKESVLGRDVARTNHRGGCRRKRVRPHCRWQDRQRRRQAANVGVCLERRCQ